MIPDQQSLRPVSEGSVIRREGCGTRLTNAFSKKVEMHAHSVALHFMHYNFVKIHSTLRTTPAQAAGVTERLWETEDLVAARGLADVWRNWPDVGVLGSACGGHWRPARMATLPPAVKLDHYR